MCEYCDKRKDIKVKPEVQNISNDIYRVINK